MNLNKNQTEYLALTAELNLKTREYKSLCKILDDLKVKNTDPNSPKFLELLLKFKKNNEDISRINEKLSNLE